MYVAVTGCFILCLFLSKFHELEVLCLGSVFYASLNILKFKHRMDGSVAFIISIILILILKITKEHIFSKYKVGKIDADQ